MQIFWIFLNLFPHFVSIKVMPTKDMTYYVLIPTCTKSPTSEVTSQMTWEVLSRNRILRLLYQVGLPTGHSNISTGRNRTLSVKGGELRSAKAVWCANSVHPELLCLAPKLFFYCEPKPVASTLTQDQFVQQCCTAHRTAHFWIHLAFKASDTVSDTEFIRAVSTTCVQETRPVSEEKKWLCYAKVKRWACGQNMTEEIIAS